MELIFYLARNHKEKLVLAVLALCQLLLLLPLIIKQHNLDTHLRQLLRDVEIQHKNQAAAVVPGKSEKSPAEIFFGDSNDVSFSRWFKDGQKDLFIRPRPVSVKDLAGGGETAPKALLSYTGLYRTDKETIVMIKDLTTGKNLFKKQGEQIAGYKIVEIKKDVLILSNPSGSLIQLPKGGVK